MNPCFDSVFACAHARAVITGLFVVLAGELLGAKAAEIAPGTAQTMMHILAAETCKVLLHTKHTAPAALKTACSDVG